jgi:hypothetical protein
MCKCFRLLGFLVILFSSLSANASVPPEYKEPTRAEMKSLGFKYRILKDAAGSTIDWHFPKSVRGERFSLVPHSTTVIVRNLAGEEIARTTNWVAGNNFMSIETSYDHKVSDVSMSITYACASKGESGCYGATTLSIPSVSKFMDANPDLVNLRPKCRNITSLVIDCTKYESDEYP